MSSRRLPRNFAGVAFPLVVLFAMAASGGDLTGRATVIDGDTIELNGQRIHLFGIDAPERDQTCAWDGGKYGCGQYAFGVLSSIVVEGQISCEQRGAERHGPIIAVCRIDDFDVGALLVKHGWALADRDKSLDYVDEEEEAKVAKQGLWEGTFMAPWKWREIIYRRNRQTS
jgi:endonuclease YncB( thermonuclease family)